jgi:chemotaxis protein histidine kinase CheA
VAGGAAVSDADMTGATTDVQQIRVRRDRLEQLLNLVGELIITEDDWNGDWRP